MTSSTSTSASDTGSVAGRYFDARSAQPHDAQLGADVGGGLLLRANGRERLVRAGDFAVSDRILDLPRRVSFGDGAVFETRDNDGIDALLAAVQPGSRRAAHVVQGLERRWPIAVFCLVAVIAIAFAFLRYGVPAMATMAARVLPASVDKRIGGESMDVLDRTFFKPTTLSAQRRLELQVLFSRVHGASLADEHEYRLELRNSPRLGPNALALPSGIVIMTDQLVELVPHDEDPAHAAANREADEEILAVLAHEWGHVQGRHALRQMLVSAGISIMATVILGDVSSVASVVGAAPLLVQAKHSRDFEREADAYSRAWLHAQGIPESRFDAMLCRLAEREPPGGSKAFAYLATHPDARERAKCPPKVAPPAVPAPA